MTDHQDSKTSTAGLRCLTIESDRSSFRISPRLIAICATFLISASADGQLNIADLDVQRMNVVRIRAEPQSGPITTSAGIYVGKNQQNAFFVTALHPLRNSSGANDPATPVIHAQIQFFNGPNYVDATVFSSWDATADVAVIYIPVAMIPQAVAPMQSREATAELAIHIIGHPPAGAWTSWTGHVQNEIDVTGDSQMFSTGTDLSLTEGFSGGPVLDSQGKLIGMHLGSYYSYTKNLKISAILAILRAWQVPLDNIIPPASPSGSEGAATSSTASQEITFLWRGMMDVDKSAYKYRPIVGTISVFVDGQDVKEVGTRYVSEKDTLDLAPGPHTFTFESLVDTNKTQGVRSSCNGQFVVERATVVHPHLTFFGNGSVRDCSIN